MEPKALAVLGDPRLCGELWLGGLPFREDLDVLSARSFSIQLHCFADSPTKSCIDDKYVTLRERKSGEVIPKCRLLEVDMDNPENPESNSQSCFAVLCDSCT